MLTERLRQQWDHTTTIYTTMLNCHKSHDSPTIDWFDAHPMREPKINRKPVTNVMDKMKRIYEGHGR